MPSPVAGLLAGRMRSPRGRARGATIPGAVLNMMLGRRGTSAASEVSLEELEELRGQRMKMVDIPTDAYGAAILAFVKDLPQIIGSAESEDRELAAYSFVSSIFLLVLNLILQGGILVFVYRYVVTADVLGVQFRFRDFRSKAFDYTGTFRPELWAEYTAKHELCQIAMWNRPFYYSVLFCWTLVMLIEIRKSEELGRYIFKVPLCDTASEMLFTRGGGDDRYVVGFTRSISWLCTLCVAVPKMSISVVLLWLGCEWLSATIEFEALVMNTVAMAFICSIDEVLFEAILPEHHRLDVENIDFLLPRSDDTEEETMDKKRRSFRKSLLFVVLACIFIVFFAEYFQDVLPRDIGQVRDHCQVLMSQTQQPRCNGWTWYLRGNPAAHECFPFPGQETHEFLAAAPAGREAA